MGNSRFLERYKEQVKCLSEEMRFEKMPLLTEELFALFETTGNRLQYENAYFMRRKFLALYGMAVLMFQRKEDLEKLEEVLQEVCKEECWALPAHVNRKEEGWQTTVDLFAAETAQTLAEISALTAISEERKEEIRKEVERRVFVPYFTSKPDYGCWECAGHNWNAVCSGGIGSACLYLMAGREEERLQTCLKRICHSLSYYLDGFEEDGTCREGVHYFTYGMTYYIGFAEQLYRYTKGETDLFSNEKLKKIAQFQQKMYLTGGQTVSFSDGDMHAKFRMGLTRFLAEKYEGVIVPGETLAADFESDPCYRFMGLCRDYLWTKGKTEEEERETGARHEILPAAQWSICESKNGVSMAVKGGHNAEPHNHNDVGSFLYVVGGEQLVTDLGAGEYTKEYFGDGRYEILCNSSMGHSVPLPNGKLQQSGEWHRATKFSADGCGKTELCFSAAYPIGSCRYLERQTEFSLKDGSLMVTDVFELPLHATRFIEQVVTQGEVKIVWEPDGKSYVTIKKGSAECILTFPNEIHHLYCMEQEHSNHEGNKEIVRLIRWDTFVRPGERNVTRFCFTPVGKTV